METKFTEDYLRYLPENPPTREEVLLVNAINPKKRAVVHYWAAQLGLLHIPVITTRFPKVNTYQCTLCKEKVYPQLEWCDCCSSNNSRYVNCTTPGCCGFNDKFGSDKPDELNNKRRAFNAVLVTRETLPELPEGSCRRRQRKYTLPKEPPDPEELGYSKTILLPKEGFELNKQGVF